MRFSLKNKNQFTISDLKTLYRDFQYNARRSVKGETYLANRKKAKAVAYALQVAETGKAPYRGRPSAEIRFYLDRLAS